jgi:hypothetical protein
VFLEAKKFMVVCLTHSGSANDLSRISDENLGDQSDTAFARSVGASCWSWSSWNSERELQRQRVVAGSKWLMTSRFHNVDARQGAAALGLCDHERLKERRIHSTRRVPLL